MTYEEFKESMIRFSKNDECILLIGDKNDDKFSFSASSYGLFSPIFDDEKYKGCLSWKKIEKLLEENKWQNYSCGKKTVMDVDGQEYFIEVYFLTDAN